jgi:hypothetical protein
LVTLAGTVLWTQHVGAGGVLSLQLHPAVTGRLAGSPPRAAAAAQQAEAHPAAPAPALLLASSMDGSVSLLDAASGQLLHSEKLHSKCVAPAPHRPNL